jgi:hypothetical protein
MESCLARIAKTEAIGLMSRCSAPELPEGYFESFGTTDLFHPDGTSRPWSIFYRQLREDLGCQVWSHPDRKHSCERSMAASFLPARFI